MDAVYIILIAIVLIIALIAVFTLITYIFLNMFRHRSGGEAARALQKQSKKKG